MLTSRQLTAFIKYVTYEFNKRYVEHRTLPNWHSSILSTGGIKNSGQNARRQRCLGHAVSAIIQLNRVQHRRLTVEMRSELVKCLRTVALLAMFSRDSTTVVNVQSALKSMAVMEARLSAENGLAQSPDFRLARPYSPANSGACHPVAGSAYRGSCSASANAHLTHVRQTHRTIAVIKALGAVALAIVSRKNYYAGAKYLLTILELLVPGIDLVR